MALYEYECEDCNYVFEVQKSISKIDEEQLCLKCKKPVKRQFSPIGGFILKGKDWHKTDYPKQNGKQSA